MRRRAERGTAVLYGLVKKRKEGNDTEREKDWKKTKSFWGLAAYDDCTVL